MSGDASGCNGCEKPNRGHSGVALGREEGYDGGCLGRVFRRMVWIVVWVRFVWFGLFFSFLVFQVVLASLAGMRPSGL